MKHEWFLNGVAGVLVVCALTVTGLVVRREFSQPVKPATALVATRVTDWRTYALAGHRIGRADAPVTIVLFSDFQCRFCAVGAERLRELRRVRPDDFAVIYRHFPLRSHPYAAPAARASECAARQQRFEAFHDALFAAQREIGTKPWERFAETAGVPNRAAFQACIHSATQDPALQRDSLDGARLGVSGTPTLLVNDMRLNGAVPLDTLVAYVDRALRAQKSSVHTPVSSR